MKRVLMATLFTLALSGTAMADQKLAGAKNCLACHSVGTTVVGPALKDIAKKIRRRQRGPSCTGGQNPRRRRRCLGCCADASQSSGE